VILYPVSQQFGLAGLLVATLMSGIFLILFGLARFGRLIEYIPTVIPAIRSRVKRAVVYFSFQQASMRARKGITCEENNLFTI
ncbi:hypothetical protein INR07_27675, partial [Klebsiella pneumoniae]|nr:hypothetical protein [Klebsiella pneumoniae]